MTGKWEDESLIHQSLSTTCKYVDEKMKCGDDSPPGKYEFCRSVQFFRVLFSERVVTEEVQIVQSTSLRLIFFLIHPFYFH